jgi:imidazolonepropionase-like amidohydrolase
MRARNPRRERQNPLGHRLGGNHHDGALIKEDGNITEIVTYDDLRCQHPHIPVVGSGREVMLPGFVHAHHHVGLTPLVLWFVTHMAACNVNPFTGQVPGSGGRSRGGPPVTSA